MRGTFFRVAVACAAILVALPAAGAQGASRDRSALNGINAIRADHGLRPVRSSPALSRSARVQSATMLRTDRFAHSSRLSAAGHWSVLGENIAMHRGWRPRVGWLLRSWMNSPVHRRLILSAKYRYAGVGSARGHYGRWKFTTWTLRLGRR